MEVELFITCPLLVSSVRDVYRNSEIREAADNDQLTISQQVSQLRLIHKGCKALLLTDEKRSVQSVRPFVQNFFIGKRRSKEEVRGTRITCGGYLSVSMRILSLMAEESNIVDQTRLKLVETDSTW